MVTTRTFRRNGVPVKVTMEASASFLDAVRGPLGIRSAARGCGNGLCGACRVLVEGEPENACSLTLNDVPEGARVEGYEDLKDDPAAVDAVAAFSAERPTRCALCVPSIGVTAVALARQNRSGDPAAVDATLGTAACMCTGRSSMRRALLAVGAPDRKR